MKKLFATIMIMVTIAMVGCTNQNKINNKQRFADDLRVTRLNLSVISNVNSTINEVECTVSMMKAKNNDSAIISCLVPVGYDSVSIYDLFSFTESNAVTKNCIVYENEAICD